MSDDKQNLSIPSRTYLSANDSSSHTDRDKAAALMREQIDKLYDSASTQAPGTTASPYQRSHNNATTHQPAADWQEYHTAWQQYYQQYYDRYYRGQHQKISMELEKERHTREAAQQQTASAVSQAESVASDKSITQDKAIEEIRNDLMGRVQKQSEKIRKSRHFTPILSALVVMSLFLFLQYNRLIIGQVRSFISPGSITAQNIIIDPSKDIKVGPEPRLIIPKINVDANVVYDVPNLQEHIVQDALKRGVIHYPIPGASANPGELGNAVFLGHSSNDVFDDGDYKFIFVQLEQMTQGDTFYINYNSTRYTYTVTSTETIMPNEVNKLLTSNEKPTVTLVTCTPIGTAEKRFLVHAEQISPDPSGANVAANNAPSSRPTPTNITGNSPTLFERLFGF